MSEKFLNVNYGLSFSGLPESPADPKDGDIYFDSSEKGLKFFSGGSWSSLTKYLGSLSEEPQTGEPGQAYFDTAVGTYKVYLNSGWVSASATELYLGFFSSPEVTIDLSLGPKLSFSLQSVATTIKFINGQPHQEYLVKIMFGELVTPSCTVNFHPSVLFNRAYTTPATPEPNGQVIVRLIPTPTGHYIASTDPLLGTVIADPDQIIQRAPSYDGSYFRGYFLIQSGALFVWSLRASVFISLYFNGANDGDVYTRPKKSWPFAVKMADMAARMICAIEKSTGFIWGVGYFTNNNNHPQFLLQTGYSTTPVSLAGGRSYSYLSLGSETCIGLEGSTGRAWAWGENSAITGLNVGNDGVNITNNRIRTSAASVAGGRSYTKVCVGAFNAYFLEGSTGYIYATGYHPGTGIDVIDDGVSSPVLIHGGRSYTHVITPINDQSVAAIEGSTGFIWTWGAGFNGQLGNGATPYFVATPQQILVKKSFDQLCSTTNGGYVAREASTGNVYFWGHGEGYALSQPLIDAGVDPIKNPSPIIIYKKSASKIGAGLWQIFIQDGGTKKIANYPFAYALPSLKDDTGLNKYHYRSALIPQRLEANAGIYKKYYRSGLRCNDGNAYLDSATGYAYGPSNPAAYPQGRSFQQILGNRSYYQVASVGTTMSSGIEASTGRLWTGTHTNTSVKSVSLAVSVKSLGGYNYGVEASTGYAWTWDVSGSPRSILGAKSYSKLYASGAAVLGIEGSTGYAYAWRDSSLSGTDISLGDGNLDMTSSSPVSVLGGRSFQEVVVVNQRVFGALEASTGYVWTWGYGTDYTLGNGSTAVQTSPVSVLGGRSYKSLTAVGSLFMAEEGSTGDLYMWGTDGILLSTSGPFSSPKTNSAWRGRSFAEFTSFATSIVAKDSVTGEYFFWGNVVLDENAYSYDYLTIPINNSPST